MKTNESKLSLNGNQVHKESGYGDSSLLELADYISIKGNEQMIPLENKSSRGNLICEETQSGDASQLELADLENVSQQIQDARLFNGPMQQSRYESSSDIFSEKTQK